MGLFIVSIEFGFFLEQNISGVLLLSGGLTVLSAVFLGLSKSPSVFPRRSSALIFAVLFLATAGVCFGAGRQSLAPAASPFPLGSGVQIKATVLRTDKLSNGQQVVLNVHKISPLTQSHFSRVHFQIEWMLWHPAQPVNPGSQYLLSGILQQPPVYSSTGVPVRKELRQLGIRYEFQGHAVQTSAPTRGQRSAVMKVLTQALSQTGKVTLSDNVLLQSIVFGDGGQPVSAQSKEWFLRAGLLHVLAASGANVFIIEWFFQFITSPVKHQRLIRVDTRLLILLSVAFLWTFAWLCGFQISIVRAVLMASYRSIGIAAGRAASSWNGLLFAGVIITVIEPGALFTPSSVLSFAAAAAVQSAVHSLYRRPGSSEKTGRPAFVRGICYIVRSIIRIVKASIYVEISLLPLIVYWFHQLTPFSVLSNLFAEPVLAVLLPLAAFLILTAVIDTVVHFSALHVLVQTIAVCTVEPLHLLIRETQMLGSLPQSLYKTNALTLVDVLSYYVAIFGAMYLAKKISNYTNM